jgi:hypothetical protein
MQFGTWSNPEDKVYKTGKCELEFADDVDCCICLEHKRGVSQFNCDHFLCIGCFKRVYYGDQSGEPTFPYSDDRDNPKWDIEYPLIKKYEKDSDAWDEAQEENYESEESIRRCPLCRK